MVTAEDRDAVDRFASVEDRAMIGSKSSATSPATSLSEFPDVALDRPTVERGEPVVDRRVAQLRVEGGEADRGPPSESLQQPRDSPAIDETYGGDLRAASGRTQCVRARGSSGAQVRSRLR